MGAHICIYTINDLVNALGPAARKWVKVNQWLGKTFN